MTLRIPAVILSCAALAATAPGQSFEATPVDALVDAHLQFLASDAMGGRDTGTPEGAIAAQYVAAAFRSAGLEPAGVDGTFLQPYSLAVSHMDVDGVSMTVSGDAGAESFTLGEEFVVRGQTRAGFDLEAPLLFVGFGIVDESEGRDAYAGLEVDGRMVVMLSGRPEASEASPSWRMRRRQAEELGAAGVIVIIDPEDRQGRGFFDMMTRTLDRKSMSLAGEEEPGFPFLMLSKDGAARLLAAAGLDLEQQWTARAADELSGGLELEGLSLALRVPVSVDELVAHNTLGMVRGTDPELADEIVVVSAHMDHVGTNGEGEVFNGADDNATGTTTLMAAARVLADNPAPRRSVVFLAVSGEEKGLLGSQWWVDNPTLPLEQVVANINIDMVGRNDTGSIGTTPSPEHDHYNSLVVRAQELAPRAGMTIDWEAGEGDYRRRVDDYYFRSDHVNFAKKGIPVVFFFSGEHEDYHRTTDTVDKIDRDKLGRMARFISILVTDVANSDERPRRIEDRSADSR